MKYYRNYICQFRCKGSVLVELLKTKQSGSLYVYFSSSSSVLITICGVVFAVWASVCPSLQRTDLERIRCSQSIDRLQFWNRTGGRGPELCFKAPKYV